MNTILISGTAATAKKVNAINYKVYVWAAENNKPIQFITAFEQDLHSYNSLWFAAKCIAKNYFKNDKMDDGAYTQFLDHISIIN